MVEVEGRADSLEKELATKNRYIRDLEDIIVEKVNCYILLGVYILHFTHLYMQYENGVQI